MRESLNLRRIDLERARPMTTIEFFLKQYEFNRGRTLDLLTKIESEPDSAKLLGWRAGPGRAHVAWQLMHIGVTEEIFATERLAPEKPRSFQELWPRFRGGSTPDEDIPSIATIQQVLRESREHLVATLSAFPENRLDEILPAMAQKGWSVRIVLSVLAWHEAHHQGQAHITCNLYRARRDA
jgi:uncharacterized damage-inducible protein DinB